MKLNPYFKVKLDENGFFLKVYPQNYDPNEEGICTYILKDNWEMFTKVGNASLTKKAHVFMTKLSRNCNAGLATKAFLKSFVALYKSKTMGEASDTAVRENVLGFLRRFQKLIGTNTYEYLIDRWLS